MLGAEQLGKPTPWTEHASRSTHDGLTWSQTRKPTPTDIECGEAAKTENTYNTRNGRWRLADLKRSDRAKGTLNKPQASTINYIQYCTVRLYRLCPAEREVTHNSLRRLLRNHPVRRGHQAHRVHLDERLAVQAQPVD